MSAKSLVCVQVPNATGQGYVFFGRICNDSFCVRHNNDLDYWGDTFPLKDDALACGNNTLMVRQVEWLCWARLRDLPGQDSQCRQVKWLADPHPRVAPNCNKKSLLCNTCRARHFWTFVPVTLGTCIKKRTECFLAVARMVDSTQATVVVFFRQNTLAS